MNTPALTRLQKHKPRHLIPVLCSIWRDVCSGSDHDQDVLGMLVALEGMTDGLDSTEYNLPDQAAFETNVNLFLVNYRALHLEARARGLVRWHEVPKFNYFQHIAILSRFMNPRLGWCYPDEDFMRIIKA